MKLGDIFWFNRNILLEYDNSKSGVTLAAPGGDRASGKNYDNIAIGKTQPYKNTAEKQTKYAKIYPQLGLIVDRLKNSAIQGDYKNLNSCFKLLIRKYQIIMKLLCHSVIMSD